MAMYHLRVKYVQRSAGRSAVAAAAYRSGEKLTDEREGKTHDYTRKSDIEFSEIVLPNHMPEELRNRGALWNALETGIKHPRGQPAFEVEVALPRELTHEQCAQLVREFATAEFVDKGLPVDINIHRPTASDGGEHPHAHILISTRRFKDDGSIDKTARDLQDNPKLVGKIQALEKNGQFDDALLLQRDAVNLDRWRRHWEDYSNRFLEDGGSDARIDHRTIEAQQVAREATPNIGIGFYGHLREFQGHMADRVKHWKEVGFRNAMREQMDKIQAKRPDMTAEFIAHARAYGQKFFPELQQDAPERGLEYER
jgi:ATP-dependent exoDNAse (exonuclease V) alpha subunit